MSKVYSFRLSDDNPREAQAREVIEAWVEEGYSLRYVIVEAMLAYNNKNSDQGDLNSLVKQLQDLIPLLDNHPINQTSNSSLPTSFLNAVKNSVKLGIATEQTESY